MIDAKNIVIEEVKDFDCKLVEVIKNLEKKNLGREASINEWVIPVIIRYGKVILIKKNKNGEIIGVCEMVKKWSDCDTAFIHSFYINKEYRRLGIGKKFLIGIINILKRDKLKYVELTIDPCNKAACGLYERLGFTVKEVRNNEYGKDVNRYLMILKL
jgi:ribosomal protein S18 acetylase RimI-like enzyme